MAYVEQIEQVEQMKHIKARQSVYEGVEAVTKKPDKE